MQILFIPFITILFSATICLADIVKQYDGTKDYTASVGQIPKREKEKPLTAREILDKVKIVIDPNKNQQSNNQNNNVKTNDAPQNENNTASESENDSSNTALEE